MDKLNGLIGFFDILGYKNFLNNNNVIENAQKTLKIVNSVPRKSINVLENIVKKRKGGSKVDSTDWEELNSISKQLKTIIFSDTIVFFLPLRVSEYQDNEARKAMIFVSAYFTKEMFVNGLPIRGALHEGDYLIEENCFAGKGIIDAFNLCESLDFTGVACTQTFYKNALENEGMEKIKKLTFEYLTPKKEGEEKHLNLNWLKFLSEDQFNECKNDVEQFVLKSFWDHNKDCSNSVDLKIQNSVKAIRKMILDKEDKKL
ncbi:hypothetical protein [Nitrosomonas ureae]|uniref:Uncharacterized protein n=1 Tax=Nitrosomonas ureae TaxID=44577 RepID=A0A1H2HPM5_9PROT|nr:hypothetical protein [Nitrosomonas ureae]ALQ52069.1 hypothetical protein ATY38_13100 [Nitrosomonas ureae]SDU33851.1 hypothetical protein SAMN05216406_1589 [Nitrosomonas ureae]